MREPPGSPRICLSKACGRTSASHAAKSACSLRKSPVSRNREKRRVARQGVSTTDRTAGKRMKLIKYGKYVGEPADAVDLEELGKRLGDFFLQSGFESQFYGLNKMAPEKSMEALRQAILRALQ